MEFTESSIHIDASPQAVWSVIDDLQSYPEWNPIVPRLNGRTTVGEVVEGELVIPNMPTPPLTPTITRIVPGREFRWLSVIPGDEGFSAEHLFRLVPTSEGTLLVHREEFDGPAASFLKEAIENLVGPAYQEFDRRLKKRVESLLAMAMDLHPSINNPSIEGSFPVRLRCECSTDQVEVELREAIAHNHLCGCSKCWKPDGSIFAQTAVVPADTVDVIANSDKIFIVDGDQAIKRHACNECGVHMLGTVEEPEHHFYGLTFVHPELAERPVAGKLEFAGFVSSVVEAGFNPSAMQAVRSELLRKGIPAFDAFSPEIMDMIAYHVRKIKLTMSSRQTKEMQ